MGRKLEFEPVQAKDAVGVGSSSDTAYVIPFTTDASNQLGKSVQVRKDGATVATFGASGLTTVAAWPVSPGLLVLPSITTAERAALGDPAAGEVYLDTDLRKLVFYEESGGWQVITSAVEE